MKIRISAFGRNRHSIFRKRGGVFFYFLLHILEKFRKFVKINSSVKFAYSIEYKQDATTIQYQCKLLCISAIQLCLPKKYRTVENNKPIQLLMTPESGNTLLMLLSLLVFTILVSGVCVFFAHNVIPSFKKGTAKGIAFSCIIEAALVALAMFILGSSNDTLSEAFTWLASLNYMWCFVIAVAAVIFNILLARLWGSRRNSWSKEP